MLPRNNPDRIRIIFDDHRLVANARLLLPATLALHLGLRELVDHHLDLGIAPGRVNTGDKMLTLVASALAGGDCIDDADAMRKPDGLLEEPRIVVVEGEAAVDRLASLGYWSATWRDGAASLSNNTPDLSDLAGRAVVLWPDDNPVGIAAMERVAVLVKGLVNQVQWAAPADYTWASGLDCGDYAPSAISEAISASTISAHRGRRNTGGCH